jgi:hypothetical protein
MNQKKHARERQKIVRHEGSLLELGGLRLKTLSALFFINFFFPLLLFEGLVGNS